MRELIKYTDSRIADWYANVKREYGVIGEGKTYYNEEEKEIYIIYTEDGVQQKWSMPFYKEYLKTHGINWVFDCWSELA